MHAYSQLMNQLCTVVPFACNVSVPGFSFRCFCTSARAAACAESSLDSDVLSSSRMGAIEKNRTNDMNIRCPVLLSLFLGHNDNVTFPSAMILIALYIIGVIQKAQEKPTSKFHWVTTTDPEITSCGIEPKQSFFRTD